jgi:replicative DNA helicase
MDEGEGVVCDFLIQEGVDTNWFHKPANKVVYTALVQLRIDGKPTDDLEATRMLVSMNQLDGIGGMAYLTEILKEIQDRTWTGYKDVFNQLNENRKLRILRRASMVIADELSQNNSAEEIVVSCNSELEKINSSADNKLQSTSDYIPVARQELKTPSNLTKGLLTGYTRYDDMTGGLKPETFVVWAARPAMGKSTIALNVADNIAVHQKKKVLLVSAEMASLEIGIRQISSMCLINQDHIRNRRISRNDEILVDTMSKALAQTDMWVDDSCDITPSRIAARARALKNREGLDLIVIDYLQIITPDNPKDIREQQISAISRSFKKLSRQLSIPVLCLAQLNRGSAKEEREPRLSDLRESGAIEQDADIVGLLHQDDKLKEDDQMQFHIAKQRNGETGKFRLDFYKHWFRFGDENTLDNLKKHLQQGTQQTLVP